MHASAAHGMWCGAKTYPTRCRFCGQRVFYFECNCGSKVFFSSLGGGWPEHRCLEMLTQTYGKEFVRRGMAVQMMQHPSSRLENRIEKRYREAVERRHQRARSETSWTTRMTATPHARIDDTAMVREIIPDVDMFQRFGLVNSSLAKAFLGVFAREPFTQLTFYVGYLPREETESDTSFMPSREVRRSGIRFGDLVTMRLRGVPVGTVAAWLCESVEFVTQRDQPIINKMEDDRPQA